ncbi:MAG TPA: RNA polymerase sigma-54 factor [Planctomycetes bacterium]|nr:RNA polymerase sigma-54 factor [Planctomycetota bacterium]
MELGLSQHQAIKQIQTLSPQMYMSMEILCLNSMDLQERVDTELENNETLERSSEETSGGEDASSDQAEATSSEDADGSAEAAEDPFGSLQERMERADRYFQDDAPPSRSSASYRGEKDEKLEAMSNTAERSISLQDHLEDQVHLLSDDEVVAAMRRVEASVKVSDVAQEGLGGDTPDAELNGTPAPPAVETPARLDFSEEQVIEIRELCSSIIFNIDERGYLMYSLEEVRVSIDPPPAMLLLDVALEIVQDLEPTGVGGRDIVECLLLQLQKDRQDYPLEEKIIREYLSELSHNRLPKIARGLGVGIEEIKDAVQNIASLNPLPGKLFGGDSPHYIKPDVIVDEVEGAYEVRVDSNYIPRLRISSHYRDLYRQSRKDPELQKYLKKKLDNAEWLVSAIRQRQATLHKIAQEIVNIQSGFLDHGISHLKALKMADVAELLGVHVSTISRGISGKYIQTSRGIYALKFFFTGGATKSDGDVEARGSVIQRIKDFIKEEDKAKPLSDIAIVRKLEEVEISISRRTVTKYREAEGIPSSRERREY